MQIIPDKLFNYKEQKYVLSYERLSDIKKRKYVEAIAKRHIYGHNRNQRPVGAVYSGKYILRLTDQATPPYIVCSDADITVSNKMKYRGRCKTVDLKIRYLQDSNKSVSRFHEVARLMGSTWTKESYRSCRRKIVQGCMKSFGAMPGSGYLSSYERMATRKNTNNCNLFHAELNVLAKKIALEYFPETVEDIERTMKFFNVCIPDSLGGTNGLSCQMIQSQHCLVTEPHVDQDISRSLSIWTVGTTHSIDTEGLFFVLPYMTCNIEGKHYSGIAVKISHGVGIGWDGRSVFHCSSLSHGRKANVYGTFFGITAV